MRTFSPLVLTLTMACTGSPGNSSQQLQLDITFIPMFTTTPVSVPLNVREQDGDLYVDRTVGETGGEAEKVANEDQIITFGDPGTAAGNVGTIPPIITVGSLHYVVNPFGVNVGPSSARTGDTALTDTAAPPDTNVAPVNNTITATVYGSPLAEGPWTCQDLTVFGGDPVVSTVDISYPDAGHITFLHTFDVTPDDELDNPVQAIGTLAIVDNNGHTELSREDDGTNSVIGDFTTINGDTLIVATIGVFYTDTTKPNGNYYCWAGQPANKPG